MSFWNDDWNSGGSWRGNPFGEEDVQRQVLIGVQIFVFVLAITILAVVSL